MDSESSSLDHGGALINTSGEPQHTCNDLLLDRINLIGHCPFCFQLLDNERNQSDSLPVVKEENTDDGLPNFQRVWSYLFRKFACCVDQDEVQQLSPVPKFMFLGSTNGKSVQAPTFCHSCHDKVSYLGKLHRELEEVRDKLNGQVVQLRQIIFCDGFSEHGKFENLMRCRSDLDNEEKATTLRFLGYLRKVNPLRRANNETESVTEGENEEIVSIKSEPFSDIEIENDQKSDDEEEDEEENDDESVADNADYDSDFTFEDEELMEMESSSEDDEGFLKTDPLEIPVVSRKRKQAFPAVPNESELNPADETGVVAKRKGHLDSKETAEITSGPKSSTVYCCKTCSKTFSKGRSLYTHERKEHPEIKPDRVRRDFECSECGKSFASDFYLKRHHQVRHTEAGLLKCGHCPKTFETAVGRRVHIEVTHLETKRRYPCDICGKDFPYSHNVKRHKKQVHKVASQTKRYPCNEAKCQASYISERALALHKERRHGPQKCSKCSDTFSTGKKLQVHMERFHNDNGQRVVNDNGNAKLVLEEDSALDPDLPKASFKCKTCSRSFPSAKRRYQHELSVHPGIQPDSLRNTVECKDCGKSFASDFYLKRHHRVMHTEAGLLKCDHCPKTFETAIGRRVHIEATHLEIKRRYPCDICGKDFPYSHNLTRHKKEVHKVIGERKRYPCDEAKCKSSYISEQALALHKERRHGPQKCSNCSETFSKCEELKLHMERFHEDNRQQGVTSAEENQEYNDNGNVKLVLSVEEDSALDTDPSCKASFKCKTCSKSFLSAKRRYQHEVSIHPGIKPDSLRNTVKCNECGKLFASNFYLKWHHRIKHTEAGLLKCDHCPKTFETVIGRKVHIEATHLETKRRFPCDICGKDFPYHHNMTRHKKEVHKLNSNSQLKTYPCDDAGCSVVCHSAKALKSHKARHNKSNTCPHCSETFSIGRLLTLHIKQSHGYHGVEVYTCEDCGEFFINKSTLRVHRHKKHNPDLESRTCEFCGKVCRHLDALRSHIKASHKRNEYICDVCGAGFGVKKSWVYHTMVHHQGIKKFECHLCPHKFFYNRELVRHLAVHAKGRKPRSIVKKSDSTS